MRRAGETDLPKIKELLQTHIATSMFSLSNLDKYSTEGHDYSMRFQLFEDAGAITGVLSVMQRGKIFPQLRPDQIEAAAEALKGLEAIGIIGAATQVAALNSALEQDIPTTLDAVEPNFALSLADIDRPATQGAKLVPLLDADYDLMLDWRTAYDVEALKTDSQEARDIAKHSMAQYLTNDRHRVLIVDGKPVCTTGFNATTPTCVQVGGVYTPRDLRNRGYACLAVAMHLKEAQVRGVTDAIFFSASTAAAKAYIAIGFRQIGEFTLMLFEDPTVLNG